MSNIILSERQQSIVNFIKTIPNWNTMTLPKLIQMLDEESILNPLWSAPADINKKIELPKLINIKMPLYHGQAVLVEEPGQVWYESNDDQRAMLFSAKTLNNLRTKLMRYDFNIVIQ